MLDIALQRCFNHADREAVAKCPECKNCFCRECVTEHEDRVVCAACLKKLTQRPLSERIHSAALIKFGLCFLSIVMLWFFFYLIGRTLVLIPNSFHEGTLWKEPWLESE